MADILRYIRGIQMAARGEEVRESLVAALTGMNDSIPQRVNEALASAKTSGVFDGADGERGNDGISPQVAVTGIAGGHRITITDSEHPSGLSFEVMDGDGSGDMSGSTYDPDNMVALAGGIAAYVATSINGIMRSTAYDPNKAVALAGGIAAYVAASISGIMRNTAYDPDRAVELAGGIAAYVASNVREVMKETTYDPDHEVARVGGIEAYIAAHAQESLEFDYRPVQYSLNPVTSHGIFTALHDLQSRVNELANKVAVIEAGGGGAGAANHAVVEDSILALTGADVEDNLLVLDGTGAVEDNGLIELGASSSEPAASVSEYYLTVPGSSVSDDMLLSGDGTVSGGVLDL